MTKVETTENHSKLAHAEANDLELAAADRHGCVSRCVVVSLSEAEVTLLVFGDKRPTAPIPLADLERVTLLGRATLATQRQLAQLRGSR